MQSFLTVHNIYADENRREQLIDYLNRVLRGESKNSAFQASFGMTSSEFDSELRKYVTGRKMSARAFNKQQIINLMTLTSDYKLSRIKPDEFFRGVARGINELGETSLSNEHRSKLVRDLKALYPHILMPIRPSLYRFSFCAALITTPKYSAFN